VSKKIERRQLNFYQGANLVTVKHGKKTSSVVRMPDALLAEKEQGDTSSIKILVTDEDGSILQANSFSENSPLTYDAYGYHLKKKCNPCLLGFKGERYQPETGWYLLGNGQRAYHPTLMRFLSPDSLSPFGAGGLNGYAFVTGDPVNHSDPSGHFRIFGKTNRFSGQAKNTTGFFAYMAKHPTRKNAQAITVASHGKQGKIATEQGKLDGQQLVKNLENLGFATNSYDIHIISCKSADPTANNGPSLIQSVSNITNRRAIGYSGTVTATPSFKFNSNNGGQAIINMAIHEKQSSFKRTPDFNFQRKIATPSDGAIIYATEHARQMIRNSDVLY
jgi:RHS repeat-associated protein